MDVCVERWNQATEETQRKYSFNFNNMKIELERVHKYIKCMESCGRKQTGLKFHYYMIWFPTIEYRKDYWLTRKEEMGFFEGNLGKREVFS